MPKPRKGCCMKNNILMIAFVLLLAGVMSAQQSQANPAPDNQKTAPGDSQPPKVVHLWGETYSQPKPPSPPPDSQKATPSDLKPAKVIHKVDPGYPQEAKGKRLSGDVVVQVVIDKQGNVTKPKYVSGPKIFMDAAFDAVSKWKFEPATLHGETIE